MGINKDLVAKAQAGDQAAYAELYRRNEGLRTILAVRHARRWVHEERMAEVDFAFVRAVRGFRPDQKSFACFLGACVKNHFILLWTQRSAAKRTAVVRSLDEQHGATGWTLAKIIGRLDDVPGRAAFREAVAECERRMLRLPPRYAEIVRRHLVGDTLDEIGASQGVSREAVRKIESQTLAWLRMSDEEFEAERAVRRSLGAKNMGGMQRKAVTNERHKPKRDRGGGGTVG